jgi:uncharacterized protein (DUF1810 family)
MKAPDVTRFIKAQAEGQYDAALSEIRVGRKQSHWIWFVFPQIHGLGHSQMSHTYALSSLIEAKAYWADDSLRQNLTEITKALLVQQDKTAEDILGHIDAIKVRSCMTLFDIVSPHDIFNEVLEKFYEGHRCRRTLQIIKDELAYSVQDSGIESRGDSLLQEQSIDTIYSHHNPIRPTYTPGNISSLNPGEIFVFGSNLQGQHGGGAARVALKHFGAIMGKGVGLQGQSYAIPTMQGGIETIRPYVDEFICFAKEHSELFFYVTRIGCGIAGFKDEEIAPLFAEALPLQNVCLPMSFAKIIENSTKQDSV